MLGEGQHHKVYLIYEIPNLDFSNNPTRNFVTFLGETQYILFILARYISLK